MKKEKNKGITLIALVVTIIVLLILAGISVVMLTGQNGILNRTTEAKEKTEKGNAQDELVLAITSLGMEYHINGTEGTLRDYIFANQTELEKELGTNVTLKPDENKIVYKEKIFSVNEDGTIELTDGKEKPIIGQYIEYDVSYTDMYTDKPYSKTTGWRMLHKKDNGNGTYDIDIISTGIPAGLYYYYDDVSSAPWAGTTDQQNAYVGSYYGTAGNNNVIAASGLLNNFASIKFDGSSSSSHNLGFYKKITKGTKEYIGGTDKIDGSVFIARTGATVRSVMHSDIEGVNNKISGLSEEQSVTSADTTGLFRLDGYTPDPHNNSTGGYYWLASPNAGNSISVYFVAYNGRVSYSSNDDIGIGFRPVVSMTGVKLEQMAGNSHVLQIK